MMLNDGQKYVDIDASKGCNSLIATNNLMDQKILGWVSNAVLTLVGKSMVEFRERLLKTTPPKKVLRNIG